RVAMAALAAALVAGCGGGGGPAGQCIFASACNQGATAGVETTSPAPARVPVAFDKAGAGASIFALPPTLSTIRIQAQAAGPSANFIVYVGSALLVNSLVGSSYTPAKHDGVY